jgi:excisionase family DNA binding protein
VSTLPTLDLLTVNEVAALLRVRPRWVYDAVAAQTLPVTRVGKHLRFHRAHLNAYVERQTTAPASR